MFAINLAVRNGSQNSLHIRQAQKPIADRRTAFQGSGNGFDPIGRPLRRGASICRPALLPVKAG
jgi:hypothetical protein